MASFGLWSQYYQVSGSKAERLPLSWLNISFLSAVHTLGIAGAVVYLLTHGGSLAALVLAVVWTGLTIFALSGGYHRLFSHRTYEAHPLVKLLLLCFGAAAFQNSALNWAADHRRHHKRVDTDGDPYNAKKGFWYAHIGWILRKTRPATELTPVPDLDRDRLVQWQHRNYTYIGGVFGFVLPLLIGWMLGDPWGGLILAGFVRLIFVYHVTFAVNSFAHMLGTQPYSNRNSSRDSLVTALLTMGEGYHNFHHTFPSDYRNGVRTYHFDPSKWFIRALAAVGLVRNLRRTPTPLVYRARWQMEVHERATAALPPVLQERAHSLHSIAEQKLEQWHALVGRYEAMKRRRYDQAREYMNQVLKEIRAVRREYVALIAEWRRTVRAGRPLSC